MPGRIAKILRRRLAKAKNSSAGSGFRGSISRCLSTASSSDRVLHDQLAESLDRLRNFPNGIRLMVINGLTIPTFEGFVSTVASYLDRRPSGRWHFPDLNARTEVNPMPVSGPAGTVAIVRARSELAHSPLGPRDAVDVRRRPIPGQSALRLQSIRSRGDVSSRRDAGVVRIGRVLDSSVTSQFAFAAGNVARRVTPFIVE